MSPDIHVKQNLPEVSFAYKFAMAGCQQTVTDHHGKTECLASCHAVPPTEHKEFLSGCFFYHG